MQNIDTTKTEEQTGGRRGRIRGWGSGFNRGWDSGFNRDSYSPPIWGLRQFYSDPVIYRSPVVTQIREVEKPAYVVNQDNGSYCGKSDGSRQICESNMLCDNDNKCVTFREDLNVPEQKNRVFRLCRDNNDTFCVPRSML